MNRCGGILAGLIGLGLGWQASQPVQAATTYPITGIQVVSKQTYRANNLNGLAYHLTVQRGHRAQLRVNLHLKRHPQTVWTRSKQADIVRNGKKQRYYYISNGAKQSGWVLASDLKPVAPATIRLAVPLISQLPELPTGCEMTATTMMLQYAGVKIDKMRFAAAIPRSSNPNSGFVGEPTSSMGVGLYVYPQGLLATVRQYLPTAVNLSGMSLPQLKAQLAKRHPVVVWVTGLDGFASHTVTMTGYQTHQLFYNDPWTGRRETISNQDFETIWQQNGRRALSY
ncbi:C39 family peptidase [Lactiplantibacillus paraxiangfangensis]|uniref:C39 family peptidase n=1 Tax=Lactiplantibacillus paraxiangfangensis TaxID=3076224 RepID=UPI003B97F173